MITLTIDNRRIFIENAGRILLKRLDAVTSYKVEGHYFAPSFRAKRWDGKERLLSYSKGHGYHAPVGLAIDIIDEVKATGASYCVVNRRHAHNKRVDVPWNDSIQLRDYQLEAVDALFTGAMPGIGLLKMPIRSGKTKTAAEIIRRIGLPTLFAVPSQMLLNQTVEAFREALPGVAIGMIGDSQYSEGLVTVATLQSLLRLRGKTADKGKRNGRPVDPRYRALTKNIDLFICDEAHHIRGGGEWYKIPYDFDAIFKVALSATAYMDSETEAERGIIWLKGVFGPVRIDLSTSDLVEAGYLMRQNVKMYRITKPNFQDRRWSQKLKRDCISHNPTRNKLIAALAHRTSVNMSMKVLIIANRLDHITAITQEMDKLGLAYRAITGKVHGHARDKLIEGMVNGEYSILIGTVIGEGIDIPSVECVINAEGGKDVKSTVQRQRNLTMSAGKRMALFIDFFDETNQYFEKHSTARLEAYQSEPSFRVEVVG